VIGRLSVSLLTIVAIISGVTIISQAQPEPLLTRHVREVTRNGQAHLVGHLPATQSMRLVLVLPHRNQAELDDFLKELYDPQSASYRKFLTVEEFTARFGPTQEDYDSVIRFAEANGFTVVGTSRNRMNLDVTGSVANVEKALHLAMGVYQHPTENRTFFAPDREPALDLALQLWHISGLDNYSIPKPGLVRRDASVLTVNPNATTGSGPDASFLGSDMRAAYYGGTALTGSGQSIGLFEFLGTDLTDLATYYTNAGQTNHVPVTLKSVDTQSTSCAEPTCDDTEQTLDMTQALGMAPGMSSLVMYIGTGGLSGQTLDDAGIFNAMATASPLNHQLSCSWNWKPADSSTDNVYFEEFAAQGQNLFVDAGDDGNWSHAEFVWPADSVYVTSVGGTDLATTGAAGPWASETGWADSGGGISPDDFAIPSWQVTAAAGCGACSQTYRNGPDVSANADFSFYVCADQAACTANEYGGTSFATPMWAGYMALVNQQAVLNGKPPLGFINPALYTIGLGVDYGLDFHDITSGGNTLGTTTGYDLSTGWGSPKSSALIDALVGTPTPDFTISASPTTVSVAPGKSGVSTITTAIAGGFDAAIALSATGQPTGVTATFNPTSIAAPGSGNSTLTLAVASTTAIGMYTITVNGIHQGDSVGYRERPGNDDHTGVGQHAWYIQREVHLDGGHGGDTIPALARHQRAGLERPLHLGLVDNYFHHGDQPAGQRGYGLCPSVLDDRRKESVQRLHLHRSRRARDDEHPCAGQHAWYFQRKVHMDCGLRGDTIQSLAGPQRAGLKQPLHLGLVGSSDYFHYRDQPARKRCYGVRPAVLDDRRKESVRRLHLHRSRSGRTCDDDHSCGVRHRTWYFRSTVRLDKRHRRDPIPALVGHYRGRLERSLHLGLVDDSVHHGAKPAGQRGYGLCPAVLDDRRKESVQRLHLRRTVANPGLVAAVSVGCPCEALGGLVPRSAMGKRMQDQTS